MESRYDVVILSAAKEDLFEILDKIAEITQFPRSVKKWYDKIMRAIKSLDYMPERFPVFIYNQNYRLAKVGKYALLYRVDKNHKRVLVMRIVYARRDLMKVEPIK